ncbi:MAG: LLM class flavin-dependent oxidoreductase, partial [Acidimicrobiales bacterium]
MGLSLGLQLVPTMPVAEVLRTIETAEQLGYDFCLLADEGLMHDVHVVLGAAAELTSTIRLGPVTNSYTRHPAATAAAVATLNELSGGRALVTLVAGGTMVLQPLGLERTRPVAVMEDTIHILRTLWSGERSSFDGEEFQLRDAQLSSGPHRIPIWVAARGDQLLRLAGGKADGVVLMAKADLGPALERVGDNRRHITLAYLDRPAYTPEMVAEAKEHYGYAIMDSPRRLLANLGVADDTIERMQLAMASGGPQAVAPLVSDEMVANFMIAGTREHCRKAPPALLKLHG